MDTFLRLQSLRMCMPQKSRQFTSMAEESSSSLASGTCTFTMISGDWFPRGKEIALSLFIANGITGVRDMGGELDRLQEWRKEIAAGTLIGPRMWISGPMLDGPKPRFPSSVAITTPEDGRRAVDDLKQRGVDFIKLQSLIPRDAVFAIADEARKQNITFVGHVPDAVRASEASNAGQKSFEHLIGIFEGSSPLEDEFL